MARYVPRYRPGVHLVVDVWGDTLHSDQVTIGRYGKQKGVVVAKDELQGPTQADLRRLHPLPPPRPRSPGPWTGPDTGAVEDDLPDPITSTF